MTRSRSPRDYNARIRRDQRNVRLLATSAPLRNSSITGGTGTRIASPSGVWVDDAGSLTAAGLAVTTQNGGQAAVGGASLDGRNGGSVGAGATSIRASDSKIVNTGGTVPIAGNAVVDGTVRGVGGVISPWQGGTATVEEIGNAVKTIGENAQSTANTARAEASAAQSTGNAARSEAAAAQSRADAAYALASGGVADGSTLTDATLVRPKMSQVPATSNPSGLQQLYFDPSTGEIRRGGTLVGT